MIQSEKKNYSKTLDIIEIIKHIKGHKLKNNKVSRISVLLLFYNILEQITLKLPGLRYFLVKENYFPNILQY